jgi:TolA-binding protein
MMMKRLAILVFLGVLTLGSQLVYAEERGDASNFWEKLREKLELLVPQKKAAETTTGGVRGAPTVTEDMYWKGEKSSQTIDPDELDAFKKGMALMDSGEKKEAQTAFADFINKYPDSSLVNDAKEALAYSSR